MPLKSKNARIRMPRPKDVLKTNALVISSAPSFLIAIANDDSRALSGLIGVRVAKRESMESNN